MGFMDKLKDLTAPYEDDDDFYDGANESYRPTQEPANTAEAAFENTFGMSSAPAPAAKRPRIRQSFSRQQAKAAPVRPQQDYQQDYQPEDEEDYQDDAPASLFGSFSLRKQPKQRSAQPQGGDPQVTLFNPRSLEDMLKLVSYLQQGRAVFMSLEGVDDGDARRLLDVCSGIALALSCKLTNASARTYFVTPGNVDILSNSVNQDNGNY